MAGKGRGKVRCLSSNLGNWLLLAAFEYSPSPSFPSTLTLRRLALCFSSSDSSSSSCSLSSSYFSLISSNRCPFNFPPPSTPFLLPVGFVRSSTVYASRLNPSAIKRPMINSNYTFGLPSKLSSFSRLSTALLLHGGWNVSSFTLRRCCGELLLILLSKLWCKLYETLPFCRGPLSPPPLFLRTSRGEATLSSRRTGFAPVPVVSKIPNDTL